MKMEMSMSRGGREEDGGEGRGRKMRFPRE